MTHLATLTKGNVVIYDRGYFSYGMLHAHVEQDLRAIFRMNTFTYAPIREFLASTELDRVVIIEPKTEKLRAKIRKANPGITIRPLALRLIKYEIDAQVYCVGTTLIDERYPSAIFQEIYHARWGIEELYKISKQFIAIEEFHAKSLRGVRQEVYAHMAMITLNRIFTNHTDDTHRTGKWSPENSAKVVTNFKNSLAAVARNLESLMLDRAHALHGTMLAVLESVTRRHQKVRLNRSYARRSMKPQQKWQAPKSKTGAAKVAA